MLSLFEKIVNDNPESIVKPQNMFTIDNPDILIPANGNIFGLYFLKKKEIERLDLLLRRIYISKLAYFSKMVPIVFIDKKTINDIHNVDILSHFRFIYEYNDTTALPSFSKLFDECSMDYYDRRIQNRAIQRMWHIKLFSEENIEAIKTNQYKEIYSPSSSQSNILIPSWPSKMHSIKNIYNIGDDVLIERECRSGFVDTFENILTYTLKYNYQLLDNGFLVENKNNKYNKFLNTNWDFTPNGNNLYYNTLAFMGLLPIKVDSISNLKKIAYTYSDYSLTKHRKR